MPPLALGTLLAVLLAASPPANGSWVGGFTLNEAYTFSHVHLRGQPDGLSGRLDILQGEGLRKVPLARVLHRAPALRFEAESPEGTVVFEGRLDRGAFKGTVQRGEARGTFTFLPTVAMDRERRDAYRGLYELGSGHFVSIEWMLDGIPELMFTDYATGEARAIFPEGDDRLFGGSALLVPHPKELALQAVLDDAGRATVLRVNGREARRVAVEEVPVTFANGAVTLQGTLLLPPGKGPHPAVVLSQTSSRATREAYRLSAGFFLSQGLAALVYDKRGTGASTGDLVRATFPMLADDALAGLRAIADHPAIDRDRIGIWGASQGGWISVLAAARSRDVAFIIPTSGPSVTPAEQELYRIEQFMRADGFPEAEVQKALAYQKAYFEWLRTNVGFDAMGERWKAASGERWASHVYGMGEGGYWEPTDRDFFFYDPKRAEERVRCPVLAVFGGKDLFVPVDASINLLKARMAGNPALTVQLHPTGSHGLADSRTGGTAEFPFMKRYLHFAGMAEWLARNVPPAAAVR